MPDSVPHHELLPSLARLVRGLSMLFWGLPATLIVCVQTTRTDSLHALGFLPPLLATGWLLFGLLEIGKFQKQERRWRTSLERARLLGLTTVGLSPFLFWWSQDQTEPFFVRMVFLLLLTGVLYLSELNLVLRRLAAMLPDETLRADTKEFTTINRGLLLTILVLSGFLLSLGRMTNLPTWLVFSLKFVDQQRLWLAVFLVLLPIAMTMALLWKIKAAILDSIFSRKN